MGRGTGRRASRSASKFVDGAPQLRLECEKMMKLGASSHCSCFFCSIQECRDKAALSESVPAGTLREER